MNFQNELINELAMKAIKAKKGEDKDEYISDFFQEKAVQDWIKSNATKTWKHYKNIGFTYEDTHGIYEDFILSILRNEYKDGQFDPELGTFTSYVTAHIRTSVGNRVYYLTTQKRSKAREGVSLDANDAYSYADGSYGQASAVDVVVSDNMYLQTLLDEFSQHTKRDGETKSKALFMALNYDQYTNENIAKDVFGDTSYGDSSRKKMQRIKKEFKDFLEAKGINSRELVAQ